MRAYLYQDSSEDPRSPHDSGTLISNAILSDLGVLYFHISDVDPIPQLEKIAKERQYKNRDTVHISPTTLPNYDQKLNIFFTEHIHEDEEIRFIVDGSGYFDVRDRQDQWVRIAVEKGDLLILPPGIYHRFIVDMKNEIKAVRLFKDEPKWTPINRPEADDNVIRQEYVASLG